MNALGMQTALPTQSKPQCGFTLPLTLTLPIASPPILAENHAGRSGL